MKKKLLAILTLGLCAALACSCNRGAFGSYSFHYVHVQMYGMQAPIHFEVEKWEDDDGGIELQTKNHGSILLGDGTYMLYDQEECPLCGRVRYK